MHVGSVGEAGESLEVALVLNAGCESTRLACTGTKGLQEPKGYRIDLAMTGTNTRCGETTKDVHTLRTA